MYLLPFAQTLSQGGTRHMVGVQSHLEFNALFYELMIHMEMLKVLVSGTGAVQTSERSEHNRT